MNKKIQYEYSETEQFWQTFFHVFRRGTKFSTRKPNASGPWMLDSIPSTKEPESEQTKGLNKETWNMWSESVLDNPKNSDPNPWNKSIHPQWESAHQVG